MSDAWVGILNPDETILWQGRPDGAIVFTPLNIVSLLFGLCFAGFALFGMVLASRAGGFLWTSILIPFSIGIGFAVVPLAWSPYRRRHSWYTLTNRRAIIATHMRMGGKTLHSLPITPNTALDFQDGDLVNLYFASRIRQTENGTYEERFGFERITDGRTVYSLMRDIQTGAIAHKIPDHGEPQ